MPDWGWVVVAGLILAILTPPLLSLIKYTRDAMAIAIAKSLAVALVDELIELINGKLGLTELKEAVEKQNTKVDGLQAQVVNLEHQVESLLTDR